MDKVELALKEMINDDSAVSISEIFHLFENFFCEITKDSQYFSNYFKINNDVFKNILKLYRDSLIMNIHDAYYSQEDNSTSIQNNMIS